MIEREWEGQTAAILASGPSLTREQCEAVRHLRTIAVNNQGIDTEKAPAMAPWADILFAADSKWWDCYTDAALAFAGRKVTLRGSRHPGVWWVKQSSALTFDPMPGYIVTGGNSGYMALQIAVQLGARKVILLGFDMKNRGRLKHWFGSHPHKLDTQPNYGNWIKAFRRLSKKLETIVDVVNCSPDSALDCFRRADLAAEV